MPNSVCSNDVHAGDVRTGDLLFVDFPPPHLLPKPMRDAGVLSRR